MNLEWSTISEQKRFPDEKRITVRFTVDGEGHKWEDGNCNLDEPNPIEESITNFFDTGNFEFYNLYQDKIKSIASTNMSNDNHSIADRHV